MSIASPTTREEFIKHIKAKLGDGVIQVNVSDIQADIAVEEAMKWFHEWHHSGSIHGYRIIVPTEEDIANRYVTLPEEIFSVIEVYSLRNQTLVTTYSDLLSGGWDMLMEIAYSSSTTGSPLISYVGNMQYYDLLQQIVTGPTVIQYNYIDNKLHINANWSDLGQTFAIEAYAKVDPATNPKIWQDRWLIRYATAVLKEMWGANLSKYSGMQLPGGISFNGDKIQAEAKQEIDYILTNHSEYSIAPRDFIG